MEGNQYAPTKGNMRLKKAISAAYSPYFGRQINPDTEIAVTTGANEGRPASPLTGSLCGKTDTQGMLSAFMGFIEPGDEVIVFEPFFDQYISNIEMPGGIIKYVPLHPPADGAERTSSAANWTIDFDELERAFTPKTRMIVSMST